MKRFDEFLNEGKRENKIKKVKKRVEKFMKNDFIFDSIIKIFVDEDGTKGLKYVVWISNLVKNSISRLGDKLDDVKDDDFEKYLKNGILKKDSVPNYNLMNRFDDKIKWFVNFDLEDFLISINDWLKNVDDINLSDYKTLKDAYDASEEWHKNLKASGIIENESGTIIMTFDDGYYWIDLESTNCEDEAKAMGHCGITNYGTTIYSLRDSKKRPHVTVAIDDKNGIIYQMKGKENKKPIKKYHPYIYDLLMRDDIKYFDKEYDQSEDFNVLDLDKEKFEKLYKEKPSIVLESMKHNINLFIQMIEKKYLEKDEIVDIISNFSNSEKLEIIAHFLMKIVMGEPILSVKELKKMNFSKQSDKYGSLNQIGNMLLWYYGFITDLRFHQFFTEHTIFENKKVKMICHIEMIKYQGDYDDEFNERFDFYEGVDDEDEPIIIFNKFPLNIPNLMMEHYNNWLIYSEDEAFNGIGVFDFDPWEDDPYNDLEALFLDGLSKSGNLNEGVLNESPNQTKYAGKEYIMCDDDDITFIYKDDKIYSNIGCDAHVGIASIYNLNYYRYTDVSGRYFVKAGVLTFWKYPKDYDELKKIIEEINKEYSYMNLNIDDNTILEIPYDDSKDFEDFDEVKFIKVKDYIQEYKHSDDTMKILHNMKPEEKRKALKDSGYKSKVSNWKDWMRKGVYSKMESKNYSPRKYDNIVLIEDELSLVLVDTKNDIVVGVINLFPVEPQDFDYGQVGSVGAERGYGFNLYKFALYEFWLKHKKPLMPSRDGDVKSEAMSVWKKLFNDTKIKKNTLSWEDDEFTLSLLTGEERYYSLKEKEEIYKEFLDNKYSPIDLKKDEELKIFNTEFILDTEPNMFSELKEKGERYKKRNSNWKEYLDVDYGVFFESLNESVSNMKTFKYKAMQNDYKGNPVLYVLSYKVVKIYDDKVECKIKGYQYVTLENGKKGWVNINDFESGKTHILHKKDFEDGESRRKIQL